MLNHQESIEEEKEFYEHHRLQVDPGQTPIRIDKYLTDRISAVSRTKIQSAAEANAILVNNKAVKSNYKVKGNDIISVVLPEPPQIFELIAEDIPLNFTYEDNDLAIINKPAGMVVHPGYGNYTGTMLNALLYYYKNNDASAQPILVHRIDKDTSGIMVIAKNENCQAVLSKYFFDHSIDRKYIALVWGNIDADEGTIEGHIGRNQKNRLMMDVFEDGSHGRAAITHYRVIERFHYVTLVECVLETGRTHQIRAHMKHIGHPLFNDAVYGGNDILKGTTFTKYKQFINNCFNLLPRQALHAKSLGFIHPVSKEYMFFDSELPADFQQLLEKWRKYQQNSEE